LKSGIEHENFCFGAQLVEVAVYELCSLIGERLRLLIDDAFRFMKRDHINGSDRKQVRDQNDRDEGIGEFLFDAERF
jgi:hypothetical protein